MNGATDCDFCAIIRREEPAEIVAETASTLAFFPLRPATLGHTLIVPKEHVEDLWSLDEPTAEVLASFVLPLAHALRAAFQPQGLNVIQSNGRAASQTVMHLHVHLVPRWRDDPIGDIWPEPEPSSQEELRAAARQLRKALAR